MSAIKRRILFPAFFLMLLFLSALSPADGNVLRSGDFIIMSILPQDAAKFHEEQKEKKEAPRAVLPPSYRSIVRS